MKFDAPEFYPTPIHLLEKMTKDVDWRMVHTILEPSVGKGNIVDYCIKVMEKKYYGNHLDIDCIEIDKDLRSTLTGKNYRVVHDDFLTYNTFKKYDLIIMNPPFSNGAAHLIKAMSMQEDGGALICVLNAETLRNPYTNERKALLQKLDDAGAEITYYSNEFRSAEHTSGVEIALIKVLIPEKEFVSSIYEGLQKKSYEEPAYRDPAELAPNDYIEAAVAMYNIEAESGIRLIQEYKGLSPHILESLNKDAPYNHTILELSVRNHGLSVNTYVREVRRKYWEALFSNPKFTGKMTSNLSQKYHQRVSELVEYDFSLFNIRTIQADMREGLVKGIEECIIELFDELSQKYSYYDETSRNIHYYNGWKTNKSWYINKKVILPYMNAYSSWSGRFDPNYSVRCKLMDIEKALNYLDGGLTECRDMHMWLDHAAENGQTKKIRLKYFYVTFYKKGTCHIEFTNEDLLKKLNIFGSQQKKWLPPGYGKKPYSQMAPEEKAVIDSFEGEESYQKTIANARYFIYDPGSSIPMIGTTDKVA